VYIVGLLAALCITVHIVGLLAAVCIVVHIVWLLAAVCIVVHIVGLLAAIYLEMKHRNAKKQQTLHTVNSCHNLAKWYRKTTSCHL
jgi:uncharacterized membrane protein